MPSQRSDANGVRNKTSKHSDGFPKPLLMCVYKSLILGKLRLPGREALVQQPVSREVHHLTGGFRL
jgi:hypothetical protein